MVISIWVFTIFTAILSCAIATNLEEACQLCQIRLDPEYSNDFLNALKVINDSVHRVGAFEFRLVGLNISQEREIPLNESTVYDPNWWVWARSAWQYYFNVPALDMDVISFGMLKLSVRSATVHLTDLPSGCAQSIDSKCRASKYAAVLLERLRYVRSQTLLDSKQSYSKLAASEAEDPERADLLCESHLVTDQSYTRDWQTVGWRCVALTPSTVELILRNCTDVRAYQQLATTQDLQIVMMVLGMILPLILIAVFGFYKWFNLPLLVTTTAGYWSFGKFDPDRCYFYQLKKKRGKKEKALRQVKKLLRLVAGSDDQTAQSAESDCCVTCSQIRKLTSSQSNQADEAVSCKHWIVIHENALMNYSPSDTFLRLWQHLHIHSLKLVTTLFCFLVVTMIALWINKYSERSETFAYLTSSAQIFWNLNTITVSWLFVARDSWPFKFAAVLYSLLLVSLMLPLLFGLIDVFRFFVRRCTGSCSKQRYRTDWKIAIQKWLLKTGNKSERQHSVLKFLLFGYQLISLPPTYVVLCDISHCLIYTLLGILVHIQTTAPFVTGTVLALYYTGRSVKGITGKYTLMKGALFETVLKKVEFQAKRQSAEDFCNQISEVKGNVEVSFRSFTGRLVFCGELHSKHDLYPHLTYKQMRRVAKVIAPFARALGLETMKLCTIALTMVFIMVTFSKTLQGNNMAIFVTAIVSLLSAMLPKLIDLFSTADGKKIQVEATKYAIGKLVDKRPVEYTVVRSLDCKCSEFCEPDQLDAVAATNRRNAAEKDDSDTDTLTFW